MHFRTVILMSCTALALAACKTDLTKITDDQLVSLLSEKRGFSDRPARITKRTVECVEVLGGINQAVYKDAPAELTGAMKTDCRKRFQGWLDDPERNSTELELADFEREDLAERIVALAEEQQAAQDAQRQAEQAEKQAQREAEEAAQIEAAKVELAETTAAWESLKAGLLERRDVLVPACAHLTSLREQLKEKDRSNNLFNKGLPGICSSNPLSPEIRVMGGYDKRLAAFDLDKAGGLYGARVPQMPDLDMDKIDQRILAVMSATADYEAALAGN